MVKAHLNRYIVCRCPGCVSQPRAMRLKETVFNKGQKCCTAVRSEGEKVRESHGVDTEVREGEEEVLQVPEQRPP